MLFRSLAHDMYRRHSQAQIRILLVKCAGEPPEWATEPAREATMNGGDMRDSFDIGGAYTIEILRW